MQITILTLFPETMKASIDYSIVKRAQTKKLLQLNFINIRDFATDKYKTVDDHPYGGGVGMIMRVDRIDQALKYAKTLSEKKPFIILTDPKGDLYTQTFAKDYSQKEHLIIICGHYEGIDARVDRLVDSKISIGNFILTGGELPAAIIIDSVVRLLPQAIAAGAAADETFEKNLSEPPQYTRPENYQSMLVPKVLLSGNHQKIAEWKRKNSKKLK